MLLKVLHVTPCYTVKYKVFALQAVGDAFNEGLYEEQARLRGIPLLESRPKNEMRKMKAKEACGNQKVYLFKCSKVHVFVTCAACIRLLKVPLLNWSQ